MNKINLVSHIGLFLPWAVVIKTNSKDKNLSVGHTYDHG